MWFLYLPLLLFPLVALYYWWREQSNVRESARRNVLYAPLPNLFWAVVRGQDVNQMIDQHVRKHNLDPLGMNMIFQYTIIVSEPELVQTVLVKQFTNFTNRRVCEDHVGTIISWPTLVATENDPVGRDPGEHPDGGRG